MSLPPMKRPLLRQQKRPLNWCPRPESNRHAFRRGIFLPLRLSPPAHTRCSWSGARLHHSLAAVGARRLLSTPSQTVAWAWLGVGSDAEASRAFADFDGLHFRRFPPKAQIVQVPCVYRFHHSGGDHPHTTGPGRPSGWDWRRGSPLNTIYTKLILKGF